MFEIPPSPTREHQVILKNRSMDFKLDPNGFVIPVPPQPKGAQEAEAAARRAAAAALESAPTGLGAKLLQGVEGAAAAAAATGAAVADAVATTAEAAAPLVAPADPVLAAAKAEFLKRFGSRYGYSGRIDALYPAEVRVHGVTLCWGIPRRAGIDHLHSRTVPALQAARRHHPDSLSFVVRQQCARTLRTPRAQLRVPGLTAWRPKRPEP
jgi:hypothetical protein